MSLASSVGLVSGLNFDDIINRISAVNARPIFLLQDEQAELNTQVAAFQNINLRLNAMLDQVNILNDPDSFQRSVASLSSQEFFSVSTSDTAPEGTYEVEVKQLATSSRRASQGFVDQDQTAVATADTTFAFRLGNNGTKRTIDVAAGTTLQQLRDQINAADEGIRASIVNDGSATNSYRLVLSSENTGSENSIVIDPADNGTLLNFNDKVIEVAVANSQNSFNGTVASSGTYTGTGTSNVVVEVTSGGAIGAATFRVSFDGGLTFGPDDEFTTSSTPVDVGNGVEISFSPDASPVDFAVGDKFTIDAFDPLLQTAQDSIVSVDGIQIVRSGNSVSDVIEGVTIDLTKVSTEVVNVSIANDNQNINGPIQAFVQAYNSLIDDINALSQYDTETNTAQPLFGDLTIQTIRNTLQSILTNGLGPQTSGFNSLAQIGISSDSFSGKLNLDTAKLNDAIANNYEDLINLFSASGKSSSTEITFENATLDASEGRYNFNITQVAEKAEVSAAQAIDAGGIANDETLTFTYNDTSFDILVSSGATIQEAIDRLNERFNAEGVQLRASETTEGSGILKISTEDYGSNAEFSVVSDQDGSVSSQLGIGTTELSDTGEDVAGLINGSIAEGNGQILKGREGTISEGLSFTITSTTTGVKGYVDISLGVAHQYKNVLESYTDTTNGLIDSKIDGLNSTIEDINDRIENLNDRLERESESLRKQFVSLETIIAQSQSQSQFLATQLSQLNALSGAS